VTQASDIDPDKEFLAAQDLTTPLSSDGSNVDMLYNRGALSRVTPAHQR
jgi:hypothetical protein